MGVYIKGMEMPTSCGDCKAFVCYRQWAGDMGDCFCGITKEDAKAKEKNADCPLVPVPPHGRLIDADALDRAFTDLRFNSDGTLNHWGDRPGWCMHGYEVEKLIADAPTVIPAEEGE